MPDNEKNPVLGIDLGTTFSAVARWDGRGPKHYQMLDGAYEMQSVVYYNPDTDEFLIGQQGYWKGLVNPENMAIGIKRKMDDADHKMTIGGKTFTPVELSARILERLYKNVSQQFPTGLFESRGTVVTVPYYFKAHQCENTRKAAELANIECIGILQEPIAASLSYAWEFVKDHPDREGEEIILVFDLGGGTFDLTLFKLIQEADKLIFEVIATDGDDRLGGMDFDECLTELLLKKSGLSLDGLEEKDVRIAREKITRQAIDAKITLSAVTQTDVSIAFVVGSEHIQAALTREDFEDCIRHYIDKVESILDRLMANAGISRDEIQRVIRVGGSSKLPCMCGLLSDLFGEDKMYMSPAPSHCVAEGAALYAAYMDDREVLGRAIEVHTKTCHALGIEVRSGQFKPMILSNRKAPCQRTQLFTNIRDYLEELPIVIYQGSSKNVAGNSKIGTLTVPELPRRPKGELDIEVTFKVHEDQTLSVKARVKGQDEPDTEYKEWESTFTYT